MNNKRPGPHSICPRPNFDKNHSMSKIKSPERMNKQCQAQGSTKSLNRSYGVESVDTETDDVIANLNRNDI